MSNQIIQNLKSQFQGGNGLLKISLARKIISERSKSILTLVDTNIIPDMSVNIDNIANKPAASITKEMYAGAVIKLKEKHPDLEVGDLEIDENGRVVANAKVANKDFGSVTIGRLISDLNHRYDSPKTPSIPQNRTVTKSATKEVKAPIERAHVTAANAILDKALKSDKYKLSQKPFYKMGNAESGQFKRIFGEGYEGQKKAKSYAKSIDFVEQMVKEDRPITAKQKDWLAKIAAEHYVSYDANAEKSSKRTLAKDKASYSVGSYEDADMPEYDPVSKKWHDIETGLEISPPRRGGFYDSVLDSVMSDQVIQVKTPLDQKIHENCATSLLSDIPHPTLKEAKAGDYEKANVKIAGLKIAIENPYGSVRKGIDPNGKQWECKLKDSYGEVSNSEGADGDPVDVFIKPHLTQAEADKLDKVFIVDQINPDNGEFDEHKVVLGYQSKADAAKAYLSNYAKGWKGIGAITELSMSNFKDWLKPGDLSSQYSGNLLGNFDNTYALDAVTQSQSNQAIAELKSKFQAVNGLEKIRLAREVLDARKANIAQTEQNAIVNIDFSEPEWTSDARINQKLIAEKLVAWIRVLSEKTVYSSSAFAKAFNKSEFSAWLKIGKLSIGKTFYFETINKPDTLRINEFDGSYLSLINVVMKLANQPIFDSVNMILDDTTQSTLTIANLKNQFPTANGTGKIALARQILTLRKLKNAQPTNDLLERNSQTAGNENGGAQEAVFTERNADRRGTGQASGNIREQGIREQSDFGIPINSPAISGTGGNSGVDKRNGELGSSTGTANGSGSPEFSGDGIRPDRATNPEIEESTRESKKLDRETKTRLQREAESLDTVFNDEDSIRADLPFLMPEQQDDIIKIEKRLAEANGMMITNGTGTGKTATALGTVKRFVKQGKNSILIVVPGDKIAQDFVDFGKNLHLDIRKLENIQDNGGKGIAITSYANFYQNESLMRREWDLVVFDEAHKINSNQAGEDTQAVNMMRVITNHNKGIYFKAEKLAANQLGINPEELRGQLKQLQEGTPEYKQIDEKLAEFAKKRDEIGLKLQGKSVAFTREQLKEFELKRENDKKTLKTLDSKIFSASHPVNDAKIELEKYEKKWQMLKAKNFNNNESHKQRYLEDLTPLQERFNQALAKQNAIQSEYDNLKQLIAQENTDRERIKAESESNAKPAPQSKVLFLSATPFAYEKSLDYAEGYLFDYGSADGNGYNSGGGYERFMMQHFGYTMRYNKLTQPDANVNSGAMQRQFNEFLKKQGALSGRALKVEADYSREFIVLKNRIGIQLDDAFSVLSKEFSDLNYYLSNTSFNHLNKLMVLEAIKANALVSRIKKHQALNRKVVLFHSFKKGFSGNPFYLDTGHKRWNELDEKQRNTIKAQYEMFGAKYPQFYSLNLDDLESPIETFKKAFGGDLMIYNGDIPKKQILQHANDFNDDDKSKDIILIQVDKGKEGVSLHDTTGKKTRVLINLGLPTKPTDSIQIEGRIYRTGQVSNAIFEYISTGTQFEKRIFSQVIAERSSTAENLALGNEARDLLSAFTEGYLSATDSEPNEEQGTGGKQISAIAEISPFEKAKSDYFATQKANKYTKAKGADYFPTPEPIGLKMVELANIGAGESALEPSAGHGAIARYFPENAKNTFIEPSTELTGDLSLRVAGNGGDIKSTTFEDLDKINKYNAIVMNPPFGTGGKTAVEHLIKATKHLKDGGRIVALLPKGGNATKRFSEFMATAAGNNIYLTAEIFLPPVTFERAGTSVASQIVVLDRIDDAEQVEKRQGSRRFDYRLIEDIGDLFDQLNNQIKAIPRPIPLTQKEMMSNAFAQFSQEFDSNQAASAVSDEKRLETYAEMTREEAQQLSKNGQIERYQALKANIDRFIGKAVYGGTWDIKIREFSIESSLQKNRINSTKKAAIEYFSWKIDDAIEKLENA